jgi:hypothetical protein
METNNILGMVAIIISVGTTIVGIINHKRIKSKCCGRKIEMELEIETTKSGAVAPASPVLKKDLVVRQPSEPDSKV